MFKRFFSILIVSSDNKKPIKKIKITRLVLVIILLVTAGMLAFLAQVYYQVFFVNNNFASDDLQKKAQSQTKIVEDFYNKHLNSYIDLEYIKLNQDKIIHNVPNTRNNKKLLEQAETVAKAQNEGILKYIDEVFLDQSSDSNYTNFVDYANSLITPIRATPRGLPVKGFVLSDFEIPNDQSTPIDEQSLKGILIGTNINTNVKATADGVVVDIAVSEKFGDFVEIFNGMGFTTRYYGIRDIEVKLGDIVKKGQSFAKVAGRTDFNIAYFYYQVSYYGIPQNPLVYINEN